MASDFGVGLALVTGVGTIWFLLNRSVRHDLLGTLERERPGFVQRTWKPWQAPTYTETLGSGIEAMLWLETGIIKDDPGLSAVEFSNLPIFMPRIEVFSQGLLATIAARLGMQDMEVGDRPFDAAFVLKSSDESFLREFLTADVRQRIADIERIDRIADVAIHARPGNLAVRRLRRVDSPPDLRQFYEASVAIAEALARTCFARVASMGGTAALPAARGTCLVCGEDLSGRLVVSCRRCRTPHHRDCWQYNGRCAVYGCAGRRPIGGVRPGAQASLRGPPRASCSRTP